MPTPIQMPAIAIPFPMLMVLPLNLGGAVDTNFGHATFACGRETTNHRQRRVGVRLAAVSAVASDNVFRAS